MSHSRRRSPKVRIIALAAVCCVALFAFNASAFAGEIPAGSAATTDAPSYRSAQVPAGSAATTDAPSYRSAQVPAGSAATTDGPSYRSGDTPATRVADVPTSQVTVTRTVAHDTSSHTLAIILAGSALGIALAGSGFALLRSRMPKAAGQH
jgi:hypothetical protein